MLNDLDESSMNVPKGIFFVSNYYIISPKKRRIIVYVNARSVWMLPGVLCVFALINNIDLPCWVQLPDKAVLLHR